MGLPGDAMTLHPRRGVDRVAEETIARHFGSYHSGYHRTGMHSNSNLRKYVIVQRNKRWKDI